MKRQTAVKRLMAARGLTRDNTHSAKISANKPVWWIDIPLKKLEPGGPDAINLLLFDQRDERLYHLRVPSSYILEHLSELDIREDTARVSLQLLVDPPSRFQNTRPVDSGVSFAQFVV